MSSIEKELPLSPLAGREDSPMRVIVDGIFFQVAQTGIARVWRSVLSVLTKRAKLEVILLDRGGAPQLADVRRFPFPAYTFTDTAADSEMLERICRHLGGDVFISSYYTTPLSVPSVAMIYDMIPERLGFELHHRAWREKELCIAHAQQHLCISANTRDDLLHFYPELNPDRVLVAHCGVDSELFHPQPLTVVEQFRRLHGLKRDYFVTVGQREQHQDYKNSRIFFDAVGSMSQVDFDILCVGGEPEVAPWIFEKLPHSCKIMRVDLTDEELAAAYSGASALIYPSLYEGFGMPVVEAMSCGCPVITTQRGSLKEVAADAAYFVGGTSVQEVAEALDAIRKPSVRDRLKVKGIARSKVFRWDKAASVIEASLRNVSDAGKRGEYATFYEGWSSLRRLQGEVDV